MHGLPTIPLVRLGAGVTVSAQEGLADGVQGGEYEGMCMQAKRFSLPPLRLPSSILLAWYILHIKLYLMTQVHVAQVYSSQLL